MVDTLHEVAEGQVLAGKYRVERVLGKGGMGIVVSAHHLHLDERVAIKFMLPEGLANPEAVGRFAREARAAVKIKSEHVARVSDVGVLEHGAPYMVMEYLEGEDLSEWITRQGRLQVEQAVEFVLQAGEAIAEAHSIGIVHRDLKPANLFVIRRPDGALAVKVLDFGISKMTSFGGSGPDFGMTKTSAVLGSPLYMSPEQMRSAKEADVRSDIWALGIILYELLTGTTPFLAETFPELIIKIATSAPTPIGARAPEVPPRLEAVILRCLEKDPARRFRTVGELALALSEFAPRRSRISIERISGVLKEAGLPVTTLAPAPAIAPSRPAGAATDASWGQTAAPAPGSKRTLLTAFALLAVAGLAATGYVVARKAPNPAASAEVVTTASTLAVPTAAPQPPLVTAPSARAGATGAAAPSVEAVPSVALPVASRAVAKAAVGKPVAKKAALVAPAPAPALADPKPKPAPSHGNDVFDER